jgi:GNAT superfamily N-acetyltransferase
VAVDGTEVAGFAAFAPADPAAGEASEPPTSEVSALLVEPRWGRRGHGSRLLAAVVDVAVASGVARLHLWLPEADQVTARFLTDAGWAPDGWLRTLDTGATPLRQLRWHTLLDDIDRRGTQ